MHYFKEPLVNAIALPSLFVLAALMPTTVSANPKPVNPPFVISRLLAKTTAYDCGTVGSVTLTRDAVNHDRFTYDAVNSRGQTLTVKNGVGYGDATSTIYTFITKDGSEFIIEEFSTGKATLTTAGKSGVNANTFNCTVMRSGSATRGSAVDSSPSTSVIRTRVVQPVAKPAPQPTTGEVRGLW
jgi:hypothetical protein